MGQPAVELRDVSHFYGPRQVLHGIDLRIEPGEVFGFLGHNGAGKTTTISILTTLVVPTSGTVRVCGFDVATQRRQVTECIGYLPSDVRLYGHMTALENLEYFARLSGLSEPRRAAIEALDFLACPELAHQRLATFSTGMRQRVGIAQASERCFTRPPPGTPGSGVGLPLARRLADAEGLRLVLAHPDPDRSSTWS